VAVYQEKQHIEQQLQELQQRNDTLRIPLKMFT
jgi:hypothetical protein